VQATITGQQVNISRLNGTALSTRGDRKGAELAENDGNDQRAGRSASPIESAASPARRPDESIAKGLTSAVM
jgi:hypothetical protein